MSKNDTDDTDDDDENDLNMLKHCSPSSVDIRRRSRRNLTDLETTTSTLIVPIDLTFDEESSTVEDVTTNVECCSEKSYSTASSCNDHFYENLISPISNKKFSHHKRVSSPVLEPLTSGGTTTVLIRHEPDLQHSGHLHLIQHLHQQQQQQLHQQRQLRIEEPRMPIKVYASCLRSDIEYKTLSVTYKTTSKELIWLLLSKYKMRHRDPKLFYLTMDINIKRTGIPLRRTLSLDDDSRPAELKSCHPWGECKFTLQMRKGGIVRIHDSVLMAESKYKCLLISDQTTVVEVIKILFHCYGLQDVQQEEKFCLYEVAGNDSERRLHPEEQPVQVQSQWSSSTQCRFVLKPAPVRGKKSERNKKVRPKHSSRKSVLSLSSEDENVESNDADDDDVDVDYDNDDSIDDVKDGDAERGSNTRPKKSKMGSVISLCSDAEEVEEVVTGVDHDDGGHFVNGELDMSYSSAESEASSEFSALRFRDSPISSSSR